MTMNFKRFIGAAAAVFVFLFLYEWLMHGILLRETYHSTPLVWREYTDMQSKMPLRIGIQLIFSLWITYVFTQIYPEGGLKNGLLYGLYFGVFAGTLLGSWYLWLPVSETLGWIWFIDGVIKGLGIGALLGYFYRKQDTN